MTSSEPISAELARMLVENLPYGLVVFEPVRDAAGVLVDVRFAYVSEQAARLMGYASPRPQGTLLSQFGSPRAAPVIVEICDRALRSREIVQDVLPTRLGMVRLAARAVGDQVMFVARDVQGDATGAAVEQLRESLESSSDTVAILVPIRNERGEILDFSATDVKDRSLRSFGLPTHRMVGVPLSEILPEYPVHLLDGYRQVMDTGVPFVTTIEPKLRGQPVTLHIVATRYQDGVIVAIRDMTPLTQAQLDLARSEARFRSTVEAMSEGVAVLSAVRGESGRIVDFEVTFANAAAERMAGMQASDMVGRRLRDARPEIGAGVQDRLAQVVETGIPDSIEVPWLRDGAPNVIDATFVRLDDGVVAVGRDVSERLRQQRRLEESERRFHMLAENAGDAVFYGTFEGLLWVSPAVETLLGWRPDELVGTQTIDLVHPDDRHLIEEARRRYRPGASTRTRLRLLRRDGSTLWVETLARPLPSIGDVDEGLVVSTVWSVQAEVEMQEALDRAEAERRTSEARLNQAARLESLGVMAGGIAHDFNNLLVGVLGNAEIALHELPEDSPARERIERITLAAQRAADLTRQLLDYTGSRSGPLDVVDMSALACETCELVGDRLPASTVVTCSSGPGLHGVRGDHAQLQQVVMNLVINASDALAGRDGHVDVMVGSTVVAGVGDVDDESHAAGEDAGRAGLAPGPYVTVAVSDDGPGMPPETLQRVFEPFFTTKPTGRGLGLAVVHGVVRAHNGTVLAESAEGAGTTMTVFLPATLDALPATPAPAEPAPRADDSPLVLVVDDDDGVREVSVAVLEMAGMRAHAERDGRSAIAEFATRPDAFAVVLLDLTMPGMSGDVVLAELRRIRPDIRVVLISGYSAADVHGRVAEQAVDGFVKKPFRPAELIDAVQRALAAPTTR